MKRLGILLGLVIILLIGGGLTAQLLSNEQGSILPVLVQTDNPDGAVQEVTGWKAEQFFLALLFIGGSLVGAAVLIGGLLWFLDRGVRVSQAEAKNASDAPTRTTSRTPSNS